MLSIASPDGDGEMTGKRSGGLHNLVLKLAHRGGLLASIELAVRACASVLVVIVTSTLERACDIAPNASHELATSMFFQSDLDERRIFDQGKIHPFSGTGCGFNVDLFDCSRGCTDNAAHETNSSPQ